MKTIKTLSLLVLLSTLGGAYGGLVNMDLRLGMATCTGGGNQCNVTINATGDVVEFDVSDASVKDLGTLKTENLVDLAVPTEPGKALVYSFVPEIGELAGKKIFLLIQNVPQRIGTRRAQKTVLKLSRQLEGEKPFEWIEVGDITFDKQEKVMSVPFIVSPNGTFTSFDTSALKPGEKATFESDEALPEGVKKVEMLIGNKKLN